MSEDDDFFNKMVKDKLSNVSIDLEKQIIEIINRGSAASELQSRRPIRELIQNADDALSDRVFIHFSNEGLTFQNDGLGLTGKINADGELTGTVAAILKIFDGHKEEDELASGNFGSGFRSTHLFSDKAEIHGELDLDGNRGPYVGICTPFTSEVDTKSGLVRKIIPKVRKSHQRPKRKQALISKEDGNVGLESDLGDEVKRCGVHFYWPWRIKAKNKKWDAMLWDEDKIQEAALDCIESIKQILLGCRWVREAIISIDLKKYKVTKAWERDYNIHEYLSNDSQSIVNVSEYTSTKTVSIDKGLLFDIRKLELLNVEKYILISHKNEALSHLAKEADLLPNSMLLVPYVTQDKMPTYTPIALTEFSGNSFSPLAFLPPHESRTKIKIDGSMSYSKRHFAEKIMFAFCERMLPEMLEKTVNLLESGEITANQMLSLIPLTRPERWFGCQPLNTIVPGISDAWTKYKQNLLETPIFVDDGDINTLRTADELVKIDVDDSNMDGLLRQLLEKLGVSLLSEEQNSVLSLLHEEDWKEYNPLKSMTEISTPHNLKEYINQHKNKMTLENLGTELVENLIRALCIEPRGIWDSEDSKVIPIIPDSEGKLWPLRSEDGASHFYSSSEKYPDLLPSNRTLNSEFIEVCEGISFSPPPAVMLAKMIHEKNEEEPEIFSDLKNHDKTHQQISHAVKAIINSPRFSLHEVSKFNFLPCLSNGKVMVRRPNFVGDLIWGVSDNFPIRNWENHTHREFIFADEESKRNDLNLDPIITNKLTWLELHQDCKEDIDDIRKQLKIHKITPQVKGIGLIRSLIFAESGNGIGNLSPLSVFHRHEDGKWELEKWIGRKMTDAEIDSCLTSILSLLSGKDRISGGWGAYPRDKLSNLHLLKDNEGEWSKVGDLCLEMPPELSALFGRRSISEEHKNLLERNLLATDMPKDNNSPGGLGVPVKMSEDVILAKINSFNGQSPEIRSKILEMMLESEEVWSLDELFDKRWVPRIDGEFVKFDEAILPTEKMVELFGPKHPHYLETDLSEFTPTMLERALELDFKFDSEDIDFLLETLTNQETVWKKFEGFELLKHLENLYIENPDYRPNGKRMNRLPDSNGTWKDGSWLVDQRFNSDYTLIFPEQNSVTPLDIGGDTTAKMVRSWIITNDNGPDLDQYKTELVKLSEESAEQADSEKLEAIWRLMIHDAHKFETDWDIERIEAYRLSICIDQRTYKLNQLLVSGQEDIDLFDENTHGLKQLNEEDELAEFLHDHFFVPNITQRSGKQIIQAVEDMQEWEFSEISIQRYWISLATNHDNFSRFTDKPFWLSKGRTAYHLVTLKPEHISIRGALIPDQDDETSEIERMIEDGCPMVWLPKSGIIKEKIYSDLELINNLPFLNNVKKEKPKDNQTLDTTPWPFLTNAVSNIVDAIRVTDSLYLKINDVEVNKTTETIVSDYYVQVSPGSKEVKWKQAERMSPLLLDVEGTKAVFTVSVAGSNLDDRFLSDIISKRLAKPGVGQSIVQKLIRYDESTWNIIDERLEMETNGWKQYARPLITTGMHHQFVEHMQNWYGGCQICNRNTPADRLGNSQEGVVMLFKERGGKYFSDSIGYTTGNVMYLCPNHKALYSRSKHSDLLWIPLIDDAEKLLKENPTQETLNQIVQKLAESDELETSVHTFEKLTHDGNKGPTEQSYKVKWVNEHAKHFFDALTQYLQGMI